MKAIIISRKAEGKRRQFQSEQMKKLRLHYEFQDAFEARDLSVEDCQKAANTWPSPTLREDIACFISHRIAWKTIIARNEKTLILEDDAVLSSDIGDVLKTIHDRDDAWNCVYDLEFTPQSYVVAKSPFWVDGSGHKATRVFQNRIGTAGYVIGPRAAARMLEDTNDYALIDAYFWHRSWLAAYQIEPAPVVQLRFMKGSADTTAFLRTASDAAFRPQSKLKKHFLRLCLETIKARNLIRGLFGGETRELRMDPTRFSLEPVAAADRDI